MAGINLNAITENATRFGTRLQETISEHTRELTITRGGSSAYFDNPEEKLKQIRKQLDSTSDREKLDAMKRLIALISKGRNVSEFFAQVVKNVASHNLEIRKLVYIYLLRYAEHEPDLALLSINTFQKDLSDPNPLIRAMALRVLSGIKVPMIGSIVVLAIKKCASDISPYVRKAAALAVIQCNTLEANHQPELIEIISKMLKDRSPLSIGSIAVAFEAVCPTRLDLLHQHYRRLCRTLVDVDEWGQADLLALLIRYARTMLPRPLVANDGTGEKEEVDSDVKLLLTSAEPLFQSLNPAVVLAVARTFYYIAPPSETGKIIPPLLRLLHISPEIERVVLPYLLMISRTLGHLLVPSYTYFLVRADDTSQVKKDKMRLLRAVIKPENYHALLGEFIQYSEDPDDELVREAVYAIGYCARSVPESTQTCLSALMSFIQSKQDVIVGNAVIVLKQLVQSNMQRQQTSSTSYSPLSIISRLAYRIDDVRNPKARACIIWLVGQYAGAGATDQAEAGLQLGPEGIASWGPDVLRKTTKSFMQEDPFVKLQIITLASKLLVLSPSDRTLGLLTRYVLSLARYDLNFDVRDRGRMLGSLLNGVTTLLRSEDDEEEGEYEDQGGVVLRREQVKLVLFEGKAGVSEEPLHLEDHHVLLGSLGAITGKDMAGDVFLPDWLEQGVESSLRDTEEDAPPVPLSLSSAQTSIPRSIASSNRATPIVLTPTGSSPAGSYTRPETGKAPWTDLDSFYAEANEEEESEEETDEDSEDEGDEEGGSHDEEHHGEAEPEESGEEDSESEEEEEEEREGEGDNLLHTTH
ncbi:adaptin N terminal region-domain-containing protein [Irpex rosettiformis]|uniref:Adaptin N terminal region-domain-containing protein n=1 Tax=Irpex rosettiformis TaxID=378272 RepID=A0ACB8U7C9_9APHY|nr:adaptin N terminal region-domain-containing protein [Irpex rosettiformis]